MTGPRASYGLVMAITKCLIGVPFGEVVLGLPSLHSPFTSSPTMRSLNTTRRLVAKLRGAHERKRRETGNCEGRKSHAEENPELVALVRQLRRRSPEGWPAVVTGDFSRACGARVQERARECVLRGFDFLDACLTAEVR